MQPYFSNKNINLADEEETDTCSSKLISNRWSWLKIRFHKDFFESFNFNLFDTQFYTFNSSSVNFISKNSV